MDNLNILLKYLVNSDDVSKIADKAGVETGVVEKTCVSIYDYLIPSDFTRCEGSHLEKKDLNKITSNFNKLLGGNDLKKIISDVALDQAEEQARVAVVVKEVLVNIRGRLQYMTAVKKKPVEKKEVSSNEIKKTAEPVKKAEPIKEVEAVKNADATIEHKTLAKTISEEIEEEKPSRVIKHKVDTSEADTDLQDEEELSKGEKIAIGVVGALLVVVIVVIIVILFKVIK